MLHKFNLNYLPPLPGSRSQPSLRRLSTTTTTATMDDFLGYTPPDLPSYSFVNSGHGHDGQPSPARWSSFIGIIIAIIGNIVISFALNVQKYAHIRLSREKSLQLQERKQSKRRRRRRKKLLAAGKGGTPPPPANGTRNGRATTVDGRPVGFLHPPESNGSPNGTHNGDDEDLESSWISTDAYDSPEPGGDEERGRGFLDDDEEYLLESPDRSLSKNGKTTAAPPYLRSRWWWAGIILMTIGECGNFLAYGFAPASIVSPLGVVALISNCLIAPLMLKEPFRRRDLLGVAIAIAGVGIVVSSSSPKEVKLTPEQIWWEISQTPFEIYFAATCTMIAALLYLSNIYGSKFILIDLGIVGLFALATKGVSSLLSSSLYKIVTYPVFYLLVFILVLTAVMQIKYLSRSLQRFDSTQVIPTQFVLFNIFTVTGSAILYRDFEKADASKLIKFFTGCLLNFIGVYLISSKRALSYESDYDSAISETEDETHLDANPVTPIMRISSNDPSVRYTDDVARSHTSDATAAPPALSSSHRSSYSIRRPRINSIPSHLHSPPSESSPLLPPLKTNFDGSHRPTTPNRSRSPSRSRRPVIGSATTPVATPPTTTSNPNRSSFSLITPGPLFVGYQLQAVVADTLKRGVNYIIDDDPQYGHFAGSSPHANAAGSTATLLRDRRVRKVKSVGGRLGGWLRGETAQAPRRKRAETMESQDQSARQSVRSRVSRAGSAASANANAIPAAIPTESAIEEADASPGANASANASADNSSNAIADISAIATADTSGSINSSSSPTVHRYHYEPIYPRRSNSGLGAGERRRTVHLGEGIASVDGGVDEERLRQLSGSTTVDELIVEGGDAPLPDPRSVPPATTDEERR
ncbi:hypothetical protein Dda_0149 [Drechslerella dactyloides]|uniref:DUF803 domain membrane protein n=1 Tax=Drechslerella dactyloides TaxID=74499 RepID=A0AAD6NN76_DREDA|nr:hypothetical protein Dda_0149 [Drechslerella dactyloides]